METKFEPPIATFYLKFINTCYSTELKIIYFIYMFEVVRRRKVRFQTKKVIGTFLQPQPSWNTQGYDSPNNRLL